MRRIDTLSDIEAGLEALVLADTRLADIRSRSHAVPLRRSEPGFESLASIIVAQQVSTASAAAIWARLKQAIDPLTPEAYIAGGEEAWRFAGLSRPKQRTLLAVSEALARDGLDLHGLCELPAGEAIAALTAIKGIGPWTAEVYLLFAAGHPTCFRRAMWRCRRRSAMPLRTRPGPMQWRFASLRKTGRRGVAWRRDCSGPIMPLSRDARLRRFCKSCVFPEA